jgi:hypothetical protein
MLDGDGLLNDVDGWMNEVDDGRLEGVDGCGLVSPVSGGTVGADLLVQV